MTSRFKGNDDDEPSYAAFLLRVPYLVRMGGRAGVPSVSLRYGTHAGNLRLWSSEHGHEKPQVADGSSVV